MDKEVQETARLILTKITEARDYSNPYNPHQLFTLCEDLVAHLAYLVGPTAQAYNDYKKLVSNLLKEGTSAAAAEIHGKASDHYLNWEKLKTLSELADTQINLIKKFSDKLDEEYKRS